ncbi:MAG: PfaD family polyunsaturated fatty acid/polyketide biosynthesis protein [Myxococcota bacterium]
MSIAAHFDALAVYGASAVRLVPVEGDPEDLLGGGGGLQESFERLGQRALVGVLRDPRIASVTLADGDLEVTVAKDGGAGRLRVSWSDRVVVDEPVEIPPLASRPAGPLFRPDPSSETTASALHESDTPLVAVEDLGGDTRWYGRGVHGPGLGALPLLGVVPAMPAAGLGARGFRERHGVRLSYAIGAMAGGIASAEVVLAAADSGLLAFFGSGGLPLEAVETALQRISAEARGPWGFNLLHNPIEPDVEEHTVDLYLQHGVRVVEASAFMGLTPAVVRYRFSGIGRGRDGRAEAPNRVFAKVSRPEVAEKFLRPPPVEMLEALVAKGALTREQAELARQLPVAEDVTAEADSGGHTDHRPLVVLVPSMVALRDRISREEGYAARGITIRIGAAGGLGTPVAVHAAFAMGADYVLTGSVNQATPEAGTSPIGKEMLTQAGWWEVASGPAPDMFEIGAKVQVLARGSMYAQRAQRLYDLYKSYDDLDAIPATERERIEKQIFRRPIAEVWDETRKYWSARDPKQVQRADQDGHHKMALVFRWYLGMTSRWARVGDEDRKRDFQLWCGPAMGAFNEWVKGSRLDPLPARGVVAIADALMAGAAALARVQHARAVGLPVPEELSKIGVPPVA